MFKSKHFLPTRWQSGSGGGGCCRDGRFVLGRRKLQGIFIIIGAVVPSVLSAVRVASVKSVVDRRGASGASERDHHHRGTDGALTDSVNPNSEIPSLLSIT